MVPLHFGTIAALLGLSFIGESSHRGIADSSAIDDYYLFCRSKRHIHLAVGHDPSTSMTISFSSKPCDRGNPSPLPGGVLIGRSPDNLDRLVLERTPPKQYTTAFNNGVPYTSEYQRHVLVEGLEPGTEYFFKCVTLKGEKMDNEEERLVLTGNSNEVDMTKTHFYDPEEDESNYLRRSTLVSPIVTSFVTAPLRQNTPVKFAIIGDVAQLKASKETVAHLDRNRHDISAIILVGDIAYANGFHKMWDKWFSMMDQFSILREKALQVVPGNHEIELDNRTGEMFVSYEHRFAMPQIKHAEILLYEDDMWIKHIPYPLPYDYGNAYHSFKFGPSHNIMLSSYSDFNPGSRQYNFLVSELSSVDRDETPWVTVTIHCPIYNTFKWHRKEPQSLLAKKYLEPLFIEHRVNFVLSGHLHAYMRTTPVENGKVTDTGPMHIILGNGGRNANMPFYNETPEEWVIVRDHTTYGYGTLEFINATHAKYEWKQTTTTANSTARIKYEPVKGLSDEAYVFNQYYV